MYIYRVEFFSSLRSKSRPIQYSIKKFKVIKDNKDHYIRNNKNEDDDQTYDEINTYKVFSESVEYDYEDEVLNYPIFFTFSEYEVAGAIPLLEEDIDNAQDIIIAHIERKFEEKINKMKAMTSSFEDRSNWVRYQ